MWKRRCTAPPRSRCRFWSARLRWQTRLDALVIPAKFGSDLAVAKALTVAARAGALENVRINLDSIQDQAFRASVEARLREVT